MPLAVECKTCGARFGVSDDLFKKKIAGRRVHIRCKQCGEHIPVDGVEAQPTETVWMVSYGEEDDRELNRSDIVGAMERGEIGPETLVWTDGMPEWQLLATVPELQAALEAARPKKPRRTLPSAPLSPFARAKLASTHEMSAPAPPAGAPRTGAPPPPPHRASISSIAVAEPAPAAIPAPAVAPAVAPEPAPAVAPAPEPAGLPARPRSATARAATVGGVFDVEIEQAMPAAVSAEVAPVSVDPEFVPVDATGKRPRRQSDAEILGIDGSTGELGAPALDFGKLAFAPVTESPAEAALDIPVAVGELPVRDPVHGSGLGRDLLKGTNPSLSRSAIQAGLASPSLPSVSGDVGLPGRSGIGPASSRFPLESRPQGRLPIVFGAIALAIVAGAVGFLIRPILVPPAPVVLVASPIAVTSPAIPNSAETGVPTPKPELQPSGPDPLAAGMAVSDQPVSREPLRSTTAGIGSQGNPSGERMASPKIDQAPPRTAPLEPKTDNTGAGSPAPQEARRTRNEAVSQETKPPKETKTAPDEAEIEPAQEAPAALPPFDPGAASAALSSLAGAASSCRKDGDPSGTAVVLVTFAPSGRATTANISGAPFAGTATGGCIASTLRRAKVAPFTGDRVTVRKTVVIQ